MLQSCFENQICDYANFKVHDHILFYLHNILLHVCKTLSSHILLYLKPSKELTRISFPIFFIIYLNSFGMAFHHFTSDFKLRIKKF